MSTSILCYLIIAAVSFGVFAFIALPRLIRYKKSGAAGLIRAAARNKIEGVLNALKNGADPNTANPFNGQTALHLAAARGHEQVVRLLLDQGASVDIRDQANDSTPLFYAVVSGHAQIVQLLLDRGASVDTKDRAGNSSLFLAVVKGHAATVDLLLEHGVNVTAAVGMGNIPLLYPAALRRDERLVRILLAHGANPEQPCSGRVNDYNFGYGLHVERGLCPGVVKLLVKETLDGAVPHVCGRCKSIGRGVSRDFVVYRSVSMRYESMGRQVAVTKSEMIDTQSFFACAGCIEAKSKELKRQWKTYSGEDALLGELANSWFEQSRASFERSPMPVPWAQRGEVSHSIGLCSAKEFFQSAEVQRELVR